MAYNGKTNWKADEIVYPEDMNRIEQGITDAGGAGSATDTVIGNRTISDSTAPTGDTGTLSTLLGWLANMIKSITGKSSWRTAPAITLEATKTHVDEAAPGIHGSTAAATPRKLIHRDDNGRAKVAAPSAADDIAIKSTVDDAQAAAIAASIPLVQKGAAGGVATLDTEQFVEAKGISLGTDTFTERVYNFTFPNTTANQKIDFVCPAATMGGFIEITVTGTWNNAPSEGRLTKRMDIMLSSGGTINRQITRYTEVSGAIKDHVAISNVYWKDGAWTITVEARSTSGNIYSVIISQLGPNGSKRWTQGSVYVGTATTLPLAVQTIPDDTVTQSGYVVENVSHKGIANGYAGLDAGANVLPDNLPYGGVINMLGDSGRFVGPENDPKDYKCSDTFANSTFFSSWNGTSVADGGKFIYDNSTYGGAAGALNSDVASLVTAMGGSTRYGPEFHIASYTMGPGTNSPNATVPTTHLMTACASMPAGGVASRFTVSFWIRLKTGTRVVIDKDAAFRLRKNGVVQSAPVQLTSADGWVHIENVIGANSGYSNGAPYIHATAGDVVQIALPVVVLGGIGVGVHKNPVMGPSLGFVPLPLSSYTANDVLAKLLTVDGAGSKLDADLHAGKTLAEVVQGSLSFAVTAGTAAALTASITPVPAALSAGLRLSIKVHVATTGPVTLNLNGLGAKSIKKPNGNNPSLALGGVYTLVYDGSVFTLQGEGGEYGNAAAADVLSGKTIGTESGIVPGTMVDNGAVNITPSFSNQRIPEGYHNGLGNVAGVPYEPGKILAGQSVAGIPGTATSDANAVAADLKSGQTMYVNGQKITGKMPVITSGADPAQGVGRWGGDGALAVYPSEGYRKGGAGAGEIKVTVAQMKSVGIEHGAVTGHQIVGSLGTFSDVTLCTFAAGTFVYHGTPSLGVDGPAAVWVEDNQGHQIYIFDTRNSQSRPALYSMGYSPEYDHFSYRTSSDFVSMSISSKNFNTNGPIRLRMASGTQPVSSYSMYGIRFSRGES